MGLRSGSKGKDTFVVVSYDFEYITEEGKEVWMKEGEVLLLLSKTNGDWWQVGFHSQDSGVIHPSSGQSWSYRIFLCSESES